MKKILLTVALLAAFVVNAGAQAVIKYDKSSHDFGKFDEEKKQTVVFAFTNTGDEPLVIQQVMTTLLTIRKRRYRLGRKAKSRSRTTARESQKVFSGR